MTTQKIIDQLQASGRKLIFAESITGGLLADAFISVPGASTVVLGSEVTYASSLKVALLGVDEDVLAEKGAVSAEVATAMAHGVYAVGLAADDLEPGQLIAVATTGNAGPDGDPVGLVFVALTDGSKKKVRECVLVGDRAEIRSQTVTAAIDLIREHLGL
jgi:nicotinamide-nucleotide amidase